MPLGKSRLRASPRTAECAPTSKTALLVLCGPLWSLFLPQFLTTPEWTEPHDSHERLKANLRPPSVPVGRPREPLRFPTREHTLQAPTGDCGQQEEHEDHQKHPYEAPKKGGLPGRPGGACAIRKPLSLSGRPAGKLSPAQRSSELGCQTQQSPDSQVSGAVTRWGVAGPWLGRAGGGVSV